VISSVGCLPARLAGVGEQKFFPGSELRGSSFCCHQALHLIGRDLVACVIAKQAIEQRGGDHGCR
jgi:hypothetical protein